jgi:hypothetical protein
MVHFSMFFSIEFPYIEKTCEQKKLNLFEKTHFILDVHTGEHFHPANTLMEPSHVNLETS